MTATLLYEGDQWLSTGSLVLMGVFTERKPLVRAVCKMIRERLDDNFDPSQYDKECLREDYEGCRNDYARQMFKEWKRNGQTQGADINIHTQECELNKYCEL
ncbi:MAG: hypothetical protein IKQ37_01520 [Bacteroidaceae bacterium]|nr:hypothetical protein [Bacteroidaceae bacterium]